MSAFALIVSDFNLPNATTWFYFSRLLAVALFFKFTRLLSMRNWDVLTLFLLVPGLLLLQEVPTLLPAPSRPQVEAVRLLASPASSLAVPGAGLGGVGFVAASAA